LLSLLDFPYCSSEAKEDRSEDVEEEGEMIGFGRLGIRYIRPMLRSIASSLNSLKLTDFLDKTKSSEGQGSEPIQQQASSLEQESQSIQLHDLTSLRLHECSPSFTRNLLKDFVCPSLDEVSVTNGSASTWEDYLDFIKSHSSILRRVSFGVRGTEEISLGRSSRIEGKEVLTLSKVRSINFGDVLTYKAIEDCLSRFYFPKLEYVYFGPISSERNSEEVLRINEFLKSNAPLLKTQCFLYVPKETGRAG